MVGQCLFEIRMPGDPESMPTMAQQLPTHVALWLKSAAENQGGTPDDYRGITPDYANLDEG